MQLSIVSTLYQSAPYLDEFIQRISACAQRITDQYELILVNDGSPDASLQKALDAQKQNSHIKIIDLSRNFGHHTAGMTGLEHTSGEFVFLIDCDLEEAPELLLDFWHDFHQLDDVDMLYGVQHARQGNWFKQVSGHVFYFLFNKLSSFKITPNLMTVRIMSKRFVKTIIQYQERNLFVGGIMAHAGYNQHSKLVNKLAKPLTTYTLLRQFKLFFASLVGFSNKPLIYLFPTGLVFFLASLIYLLYLSIWQTVFSANQLIILATLILLSAIFLCSGILGLYLANINDEIKNRPRSIIKHIY
jgi:putative glycosyltransferase